jgi:hypothetical protein
MGAAVAVLASVMAGWGDCPTANGRAANARATADTPAHEGERWVIRIGIPRYRGWIFRQCVLRGRESRFALVDSPIQK